MNLFLSKPQSCSGKPVALEDLMLTKDLPTTGGSRMLEGYLSLFDADVIERLSAAGYGVAGKVNIGEFGIDLMGETSYFGACQNDDGALASATSRVIAQGEALAVVGLDINGTQRRAAAQSGQVCIKPTYGTVSRYGTIAIACSGETVCVTAGTAGDAQDVLAAMAGHDDKDGTSLPESSCARVARAEEDAVKKVAVASSLVACADEDVQARIRAAVRLLEDNGYTVEEIDDAVLHAARPAWNILMSAELCNNVSRFDGVKYGYRSSDYDDVDTLYTNSRTEAFGMLTKAAVLFGSDVLAEDNYDRMYDKAMRVRRVVCEAFAQLFGEYSFVLLPACGKAAYLPADVEADRYLCFRENVYTAPASITGLPAVVAGGVQLVGPAFSDAMLLSAARLFETAS